MDRKRAIALFAGIALLLSGCGERPRVSIFPPETAEDIARGKVVYTSYCAGCHGEPTRGNPPQLPPLQTAASIRSDSGGLVRQILFNPAHRRPETGDWLFTSLSDQDVARVANHLRRPVLGGALPVQAKTVTREKADPPEGSK